MKLTLANIRFYLTRANGLNSAKKSFASGGKLASLLCVELNFDKHPTPGDCHLPAFSHVTVGSIFVLFNVIITFHHLATAREAKNGVRLDGRYF